jgi:hopene-associated glycosyltransferase HpnB
LLVLASVGLAAWVYLTLLHGRFWILPRTPRQRKGATPRVAAIVPARNEAEVIEQSLTSLLQQEYAGEFHVYLVDDHSSDETRYLADGLLKQFPQRLTIIAGKALPQGWSGKVWAMQQGWEAAQSFDPEYVWLTDADIYHGHDKLFRMVSTAMGRYEMVSTMVLLHCETIAEKLFIPVFVYFFFLLYPPRWVANPHRKLAGAAGGSILVAADCLRKVNAFSSIRGEIIDDCSLARKVKDAGGRIRLLLTVHSRSIRTYTAREIRGMISRTAFNQLGHSTLLLFGCVVAMLAIFIGPFVALFADPDLIQAMAAVACLLMFLTYVPIVRHYRLFPLWVLALPLAALFYVYATIRSAVSYWSGRGGEWKGRSQDAASA